jgi:hypothetical protein
MPDLVRPADSAYMWNEEGVYGEQWYKDLTPNVSCMFALPSFLSVLSTDRTSTDF